MKQLIINHLNDLINNDKLKIIEFYDNNEDDLKSILNLKYLHDEIYSFASVKLQIVDFEIELNLDDLSNFIDVIESNNLNFIRVLLHYNLEHDIYSINHSDDLIYFIKNYKDDYIGYNLKLDNIFDISILPDYQKKLLEDYFDLDSYFDENYYIVILDNDYHYFKKY